jgi:uncharacterized protein (DUF1697 family)
MQRYIAFLRAINVGGRQVKMDRLRALFEEMGFEGVETFIASGNVIFDAKGDAAKLETKIETHLKEALGFEVATFLRTPAELAALAALRPFDDEETAHGLYVGFLKAAPSAEARDKLMSLRTETTDFDVRGREVWWLSRISMADSRISNGTLEKALRMSATFRNVTTVRKLAAKYPVG